MKKKTYICDYNCVTPLGFDVQSNWNNILAGNSAITSHQILEHQPEFLASIMDTKKLEDRCTGIISSVDFTKVEQMLLLSLQPLLLSNKISEKSLLLISTTKGNVSLLKNEELIPNDAYLHFSAQKIASFCGFKTKPIVISNACVSGVMAVSVAKNLVESGMYDNAFVVAGDQVSEFVISGFNSFQALSNTPCKPYDKNRDGISIGEAAAAAFISTQPSTEKISFEILGDSSINDANHISGPSRTGEGLFKSIQNALKEAQIKPGEIDYISAHGTATIYNDEMESIAFGRSGLQDVPVNSLKGYYGHTLGAAGLLEMVIAMESSVQRILIASKNFEQLGVSHDINIINKNQPKDIIYILKTASGFGGCNAAIILKKNFYS